MKIDPDTVVTVSLPLADFVFMGQAAADRPYREAAGVIQRLNAQLSDRVSKSSKRQKPRFSEPKPEAKAD